MTTHAQAQARVVRALQAPGTRELEAVVDALKRDIPRDPLTWYAGAELLLRRGDAATALKHAATALSLMLGGRAVAPGGTMSIDSVIRECLALPEAGLGPALPYFIQFGSLMDRTGRIHGLGPSLRTAAAPLLEAGSQARISELRAQAALGIVGFNAGCSETWGSIVFAELVLPWIEIAAREGQFNLALLLEAVAYNVHVKRRESQEWFKETAGRWIPLLAEGARDARGRLAPVHGQWRTESVRRVGFFIHKASMLAHVIVLHETLRAVHEVGARNFEFTLFVLAGRDPRMHAAFEECGVRVRYLDYPDAGGMHTCLLALARILREENFAALIWISLVTAMAAAFPLRIAPLQAWWAMKYHACDLPEIDARLGLEHVVLRKRMEGHEWLTIGNASSEWLDPSLAGAARELRSRYAADVVVAACIGREEKLDSPPFLDAIATLLQRHPNLHFIWTGRERRASIQGHFERAGVADRTEFAGWVNTKLYAQAVDLFLDSFPFPCGFTLKEAMAAGKPSVVFRSPESLETGIPGGISPVVRNETEIDGKVRSHLRRIFTEKSDFDLYACADTPAEYVAIASALISDPGLRAKVGAANRAYIEAYVSSPEIEAAKFLDHLEALFAAIPREDVHHQAVSA